VAGSLNAAETVMALGETDRLAALPEIAQEGRYTTFREQAEQVPNALPGGFADDPEQILALEPDLVLLTLAHDGEEDVFTMLTEAGVPVVAMDSYPATVDEAISSIRTIAQAIGSDVAAEAHVEQIEERADAVAETIADSTEEPRVLYVSMWLDDGPYGTGPGTLTHDLLRRAGATNALEEVGFDASDYVDVEQIVAAAPTHIITQDPEGVGLDVADGFLDHPGLADVPAIAEDRILVLPNGFFSPSIGGIDGLEQMAAWLHDPDARTEVQ
jgi:iron complex transport system substrate-binding protein